MEKKMQPFEKALARLTRPYPTDRHEALAYRIALIWLKQTEEMLTRGVESPASLTAALELRGVSSFITDAEHCEVGACELSGFTVGPRVTVKIAARAKSIAVSYLRAGYYPLTMAHFTSKGAEAKPVELTKAQHAEKAINEAFAQYSGPWDARGIAENYSEGVDLSPNTILAAAKRMNCRIRPAYRIRPQGCLRTQMEQGYYPAKVSPSKPVE